MKTKSYFLLIVNAVLALGLTVLSFQYVQPKHCYNFCDPSYVVPCPKGSCYFGDQRAGWPFPVFVDSPGGGSPTGGWGMLGPEDPPDPLSMIGNVLFYSSLAWVVWYGIQSFRRQAFPVKRFRTSLMLNAFLGVCLWVFYLIFTFTLGFQMIGRGHRDSVNVETSRDMTSAMVFEPTVSVPLGEVIDYYGNPDTVWFTSGTGAKGRTTGMLLYWDAVPVYVELPPIAGETYPVHRKTAIERIIFYDAGDVTAFAGHPVGEEKTAWTGYGNYRP